MNHRDKEGLARQIRSTIKAIVAQLDSWESDQFKFRVKRKAANALSGGLKQRLAVSRARACATQETDPNQDPPCDLCGSSIHLSDECDFIAVESNGSDFEEPSVGIHRGIIHRLYVQTIDLYRLLYPRFYPGPSEGVLATTITETLPVPLTGPDYQAIGIAKAAKLLSTLEGNQVSSSPNIQRHCTLLDQAVLPFYSAAFPLDFITFRN
jgi:hypothetical protein